MHDLARLCWAYRDLLIERTVDFPGIVEAYYAQDAYARLIDDLPHLHAPPDGDILVAEDSNGALFGCAMFLPLDLPKTCEIKRVFVDPHVRGTGAGRALMQAGMAGARAAGYQRMLLDTMVNLNEAITLYRGMGFAPCEPFYDLRPEFADAIRFFGRDL
jgi:GNAT superfamily N-acetyltransferase